jgi:FixJ family two-component response regulator
MKGNELAEQLGTVHPDTKVIFISGFTQSLLSDDHMSALLEKPFSEADLLDRVHQALGTDEDPDVASTGEPAC